MPAVALTNRERSTAYLARPWRPARIEIRREIEAHGRFDALRGELAHVLRPDAWRHFALSLLATEIGALAGGGDRQAVDVAAAPPWQRVAQAPALSLKRRQRALHLILGAGAHSAAVCQPRPVARVRTRADGREQQDHRQKNGTHARGEHCERDRDHSRRACGDRPSDTAIPADGADSSRSGPGARQGAPAAALRVHRD